MTLDPNTKHAIQDVLQEGAKAAADALSKLTKKTVELSSISIETPEIESIPSLTSSNTQSTMVVLNIDGDAPGVFVILFTPEQAQSLADVLIGSKDADTQSALTETGNIVAGSLCAALNEKLQMSFYQSVPDSGTDLEQAMIESVILELIAEHDHLLRVETVMNIQELEISARVVMFFSPDSL